MDTARKRNDICYSSSTVAPVWSRGSLPRYIYIYICICFITRRQIFLGGKKRIYTRVAKCSEIFVSEPGVRIAGRLVRRKSERYGKKRANLTTFEPQWTDRRGSLTVGYDAKSRLVLLDDKTAASLRRTSANRTHILSVDYRGDFVGSRPVIGCTTRAYLLYTPRSCLHEKF